MDNTGSFLNRLKHAWNIFTNKEQYYNGQWYSRWNNNDYSNLGPIDFSRPDRIRYARGKGDFSVYSLYTRMAIDIAAYAIKHVRVDKNGRFIDIIDDDLHKVLTLSANTDQTGRAFIQDVVMSMFDEGCVAVVPVETNVDPSLTESYAIQSVRVGKITAWHPKHVDVCLYNESKGLREEITVEKKYTAIIENPLYAVMNESNSTLKRLLRKLSLLDEFDENIASGKLDLIIQLPYVVKTPVKQEQAEKRRKDIEDQLSGSKYGIAYTDGTEKITQLNRPLENNFQSQIEFLTNQLYSQLGLTPSVFDGTASEAVMLNYYSRTIEPILSALTDEFTRKFLTKTARTQGQKIMFMRDPFKLIATSQLAEIADKFTRNEILSSNELRAIVGMYPSDDPKADELRNKNLSSPENPTEHVTIERIEE